MLKYISRFLILILLLASLTLLYFTYTNPDVKFYVESLFGLAPCQNPIKYSLGQIDARFGVTDSQVLRAISDAEKVWSTAAGKQLFAYATSGPLKIDLIYDNRQAATDKLKSLGLTIDSSTSSYQRLKQEYIARKAQYERDNQELETLISSINTAKSQFESDAQSWNKKGGAPKNIYDQLTAERTRIESMIAEANQKQDALVSEVSEINALVDALNSAAKDINAGVETYNKVGQSAGKEFNEGIYESSGLGQKIEIYQFSSRQQLVRVLAHELGHALGLEHVSDPKAIMYELNQASTLTPDATDIAELKAVCHLK